jgi:hypothetical protein
MAIKKFKTQDGTYKQVEGGGSHLTRIGPMWKEVEERFWRSAYAAGCISQDMVENTAMDHVDHAAIRQIERIAVRNKDIMDVMRNIYESNDLDALAPNGRPKINLITERLGYRVTNSERDALWYKLQEDLK